MKTKLVFEYFPYAAVALFVAAALGRLVLSSRPVGSAPERASTTDRVGWWWRAAWCLLLSGHLVALALPARVLAWNAHPARLYALEGAAFAIGLGALAAWVVSARRHFGRRAPLAGELADSVFLSLLATGLLSGLAIAVVYRWASTWGVATLTPYVLSLPAGAPRKEYLEGLPFLVQLHVFSAPAALAAAPFTTTAGALARRLAETWQRAARAARRPAPPATPDSVADAFPGDAGELLDIEGPLGGSSGT